MNAVTINLILALNYAEKGGSIALSLAILAVKDALSAANRVCDNAAKRTCLRVLNWLRAAMRAARS